MGISMQQLEFCLNMLDLPSKKEQIAQFATYLLEEWDCEKCFQKELIGNDTERQLQTYIDLLLCVRKAGVFPFYTSRLLALFFLQKQSENQFLLGLSSYADQVGIRHALQRFTALDREVDVIQLICEQYASLIEDQQLLKDHHKVAILKEAYVKAFQSEVAYHGCSQCVLLGLGNTFKELPPLIFKAATSLSGGIAQCGDGACGAYSGAIMYMGLLMGREVDQLGGDKTDLYHSFAMAQRLHDKFIETYGGVRGMDVHKAMFKTWYLLRDPIQKQAFTTVGAHELVCPCVVGTAARWVAEILLEEELV